MTTTQAPTSAWSPLRQPVFRALWIASVASNVGTWMQNVGAAWLMTSLTPSPVMVALLQTAASLPVFLLGLPAGALADIVDRRRLLLVTQGFMLAAAGALSALTLLGATSPAILLLLTFLLGVGGALNAPAWQAIVPELVDRRELPAAVALNGAGFNLARALGPAIAGLLVAAAGPAFVFLLNAASFVGVLGVIYRWRRPPRISMLPAERVVGAMQAGLRYVRHAPALHAVLVRTGVFVVAGSAIWALLPVVARVELGLDASGYGVLLASLGLGAVAGTALLPRLRRALPGERLLLTATLVFAGATLSLALLRNLGLVCVALLAGGMAWIALMSSFNVAAQTRAPAWVLARALGVYLLVQQGGLAVGSAVWGALAERFGDPPALVGAAVVLIAGLAAAARWRLPSNAGQDFARSAHWPEPVLVAPLEPDDGPVLVEVEYRVAPADAPAFAGAMEAVARLRRRDGAIRWGLFRDAADPEHYIETFLVQSWAEHLRQHDRVVVGDREIEERSYAYQIPGTPRRISHFIAQRPDADGAPAPVAAEPDSSAPRGGV